MASQNGCAAVVDIAQRLFLNRRQCGSAPLPIGIPVEADNVGHLQHENLDSLEVLHELVERIGDRLTHLPRQVRIDLCALGAAMAQILLNDAQVDTRFD